MGVVLDGVAQWQFFSLLINEGNVQDKFVRRLLRCSSPHICLLRYPYQPLRTNVELDVALLAVFAMMAAFGLALISVGLVLSKGDPWCAQGSCFLPSSDVAFLVVAGRCDAAW